MRAGSQNRFLRQHFTDCDKHSALIVRVMNIINTLSKCGSRRAERERRRTLFGLSTLSARRLGGRTFDDPVPQYWPQARPGTCSQSVLMAVSRRTLFTGKHAASSLSKLKHFEKHPIRSIFGTRC